MADEDLTGRVAVLEKQVAELRQAVGLRHFHAPASYTPEAEYVQLHAKANPTVPEPETVKMYG